MTKEEVLKTIEGKLFYSNYYKMYVVVMNNTVLEADLTKMISDPTEEQVKILVKDLEQYMRLDKTISVAEEIINELMI